VTRRFTQRERHDIVGRMASSKGARVFAFVILIACLAVIGGGAWHFFGRDYFHADDVADDDEPDEIVPDLDGGTHRVHHPGKRHGRKGATKRASGVHAHPATANYGPPGRSYESAISGNREQISIGGGADAPDLSDAQLAGPLRNATFVGGCGAPDSMHVTVKVAIRTGRAVGVSVYTSPPSAQIAACIDHSVREIAWPVNAKLDSFVTTY
jgi:hypothetical protein